jgi:hypothetical protein
MPNTLAHIAVSRLLLSRFSSYSDILLIYIGCIIPDLPWIMQRILHSTTNTDPFDLRLYAIAQASLFMCIIISCAIACIMRNPMKAALLLISGSLVHLLLDATQTKWANGVHLLAPFDWSLINFGLYWPESNITYFLTFAGFIALVINLKPMITNPIPLASSTRRFGIFAALILTYMLAPLSLLEQIERSGSHYVDTLRDSENRTQKQIEIDRVTLLMSNSGDYTINTFGNNKFILKNIAPQLEKPATISLKGNFIDNHTIQVNDYHLHNKTLRDGATLLGLSLILFITIGQLIQAARKHHLGR